MAFRFTKAREIGASLVAIVLIILLAAFVLAAFGIRVPVLSSITDMVGFHAQT